MTQNAKKAAQIIKNKIGNFTPKVAIILGSGLGAVSAQVENPIVISYSDLPGFQVSHVEGHAAKLHVGMLKGVPVACLEGRAHTYEGINEAFEVIRTLVRTMKLLGCEILLTTNAVGSLQADWGPGNLFVLKDHINCMANNILMGKNDDEFGGRFVSMDGQYDPVLRDKIMEVAKKYAIPLREGVFCGTSGPTFESHAEIKMFKMFGSDAVGMSTIPEVMVARHCGLRVASISAVTNLAAGLSSEVLSHEGTLKGAAMAVEHLAKLILKFVEEELK